ncbi:MAG: putative signal-transduction protein with domain [Acidobacteria bacterium]|nr:putative signal-transduction protein with domain [Acidobacteriota bacterium]
MAQRSIRSIVEQQEVITAPDSMTVSEAAGVMREKKAGAILIVNEGRLAGIFTERDALYRVVAEGRDAKTTRLADVMTRDPRTIHPDKPFAEALQIMHDGGFRNVPVVENGRPVGIVSASDALGPELKDFIFELLRQDQAYDVLPG